MAITQGQRQSSTNQAEQSYHAVVVSVEFKCTVRDFSELSSVNPETELQYNYRSEKQHTDHNETTVNMPLKYSYAWIVHDHNRNKQFFLQNIWGDIDAPLATSYTQFEL